MTQGGTASAGTGPDVVGWLQSEGPRFRDTPAFVEALANELLSRGVAVWRLTTGIPILHPQIDSASCLWEQGKPVSERRFVADAAVIGNSPLRVVYAGGAVRR